MSVITGFETEDEKTASISKKIANAILFNFLLQQKMEEFERELMGPVGTPLHDAIQSVNNPPKGTGFFWDPKDIGLKS